MNKELIITGWGIDYACAAAIALRKLNEAELVVSSKRRLPEHLTELASQKDCEIRKIHILGVSLAQSPDVLISAMKKLKRRGVKIAWISVYKLPEWFTTGIHEIAEIATYLETTSMAEAAIKHFKLPENDVRTSGILRLVKLPEKNKEDADRLQEELLEAAASRYRRFQDAASYPKVIKLLAKGATPDEKQLKMLEEYRKFGKHELRGKSQAIQNLREISAVVGRQGNCRVLITGETGTGKEVIANLIHGHSPRSHEPFIAFNCADLSPQLIESRLFGHEKGAFTGADRQRDGAFKLADGGTLFLDEVGELPLNVQAGLLRVIQEGCFKKLGSDTDINVDVRIIAATNRNLPQMVARGEFRQDLFFRLNVVHIHTVPLRERPEDIAEIANDYMRKNGKGKLSQEQIEALQSYNWPGNVRELQNILERAIIFNQDDFAFLIAEHKKSIVFTEEPESDSLDEAIRRHIRKVLDRHEGNKTHARKALGISLNTLKKYLK